MKRARSTGINSPEWMKNIYLRRDNASIGVKKGWWSPDSPVG